MPGNDVSGEPSGPKEQCIVVPPLPEEDGGYHRLATYMGLYPEVAIFRRFATLNTKNILYLQSELVWLERELTKLIVADNQFPDARRQHSKAWFVLSNSQLFQNGNKEQYDVFLKIREVLHAYNKAILQQEALVRLPRPTDEALSAINQWMIRPDLGNITLEDADKDLWATTRSEELLALEKRDFEDPLSSWVTNSATSWFHRSIGRYFWRGKAVDFIKDPIYYGHKNISRVSSVIVLSLSSLLPLLSILVLNTVHRMSIRLGVIALFTVLFSMCLGLVTSARRVEIFSAAAAYAAVQVVFIAGNGIPADQMPKPT